VSPDSTNHLTRTTKVEGGNCFIGRLNPVLVVYLKSMSTVGYDGGRSTVEDRRYVLLIGWILTVGSSPDRQSIFDRKSHFCKVKGQQQWNGNVRYCNGPIKRRTNSRWIGEINGRWRSVNGERSGKVMDREFGPGDLWTRVYNIWNPTLCVRALVPVFPM